VLLATLLHIVATLLHKPSRSTFTAALKPPLSLTHSDADRQNTASREINGVGRHRGAIATRCFVVLVLQTQTPCHDRTTLSIHKQQHLVSLLVASGTFSTIEKFT